MLLAIPIGGYLWAYGGKAGTSKAWRRIAFPAIVSILYGIISASQSSFNLVAFLALFGALWGAFSVGYGIPDSTDEGSPLGRLWFNILKRQGENRFNMSADTARKVNIAVRTSCAIFYSLALLPLGALGNWWAGGGFVVFSVVLSTCYIRTDYMIGELNLEEILVGASIGAGASIICLT